MIKLTINRRVVEVEEGSTILQAAKKLGIFIPTFCTEPERIYIPNDIEAFTSDIWNNLNEQNKISMYVRYVDLETGEEQNRMINKNK